MFRHLLLLISTLGLLISAQQAVQAEVCEEESRFEVAYRQLSIHILEVDRHATFNTVLFIAPQEVQYCEATDEVPCEATENFYFGTHSAAPAPEVTTDQIADPHCSQCLHSPNPHNTSDEPAEHQVWGFELNDGDEITVNLKGFEMTAQANCDSNLHISNTHQIDLHLLASHLTPKRYLLCQVFRL